MKIALIGDLQYRPGEEDELRRCLAQAGAWKPDLAVSMGDMGASGKTGTREGMEECARLLSELPCRQVVLLGNHDVEYRLDDGFAREPERWYAELFGRREPWQAIEAEGVFVLCVSIEPQPREGFFTQHALYVSQAQFRWAQEQLEKHRAWPTVLVSHAPLAGSGLRCVPFVHSAATDAYLDHTFDAWRWRRLADENPQIRLWCSAHFHMGHDYRAAITREGTLVHVSCGVPASCARDGTRHTRLLEISGDSAVLSTMDHLAGEVRRDAVVPLAGGADCLELARAPAPGEVFLGEDRALAVYPCPQWRRAYITTEYGKLWEYDLALRELTGAILRQTPVRSVGAAEDRLWVEDGNGGTFSVGRDDRRRFEVRGGSFPPERRPETAVPAGRLERVPFARRAEREGEYIAFDAR